MKLIFHREDWNRLVKSFPGHDVYYLYEYARSLELHGDGTPVLLYWKGEKTEICYTAMLQDIAAFDGFHGSLANGRFYDLTTPYGYGGPLVKGCLSGEDIRQFLKSLTEVCKARHIVSQFFRFNPFVEQQDAFFEYFEAKRLKNTIFMDLKDQDTIIRNMDPKNRNMVRKARKNHIEIFSDTGAHRNEFIRIYHETMQRNAAADYYYFKEDYFSYLQEEFSGHLIYFYAVYEQKIISAALFLYNERLMHYHLSGTLREYRTLASVNLLLYEAALWGSRKGIEKLHLGGGMEADDSLYGFKKQFHRNGALPYTIGRYIFDPDMFEELVRKRAEADPDFDANQPFLIRYRAENQCGPKKGVL